MCRWKDNPCMPHGLVYEGVQSDPMEYSGGSAAQSSLLHCFDELLGVKHEAISGKNAKFFNLIVYNSTRLTVAILLPIRCISDPHEELHAAFTQATDSGHLVTTIPKEFCPRAGWWVPEAGFSALCHKTVGSAQLPHQHSQSFHHCACCPRTTNSSPGPRTSWGDNQQSTNSIRGERHRWL